MLVYRGMDIGTAKPSKDEQMEVRHHLIDIINPDEPFSAALYQKLAKAAAEDIHKRGKIPILAGGTGFYINAVAYGCDFKGDNEAQNLLRDEYTAFAKTYGKAALHGRLKAVDPAAADLIHENNIRRVARALAFYDVTGTPISTTTRGSGRKLHPITYFFSCCTATGAHYMI
jgi:tRNA dimethylallyltransferase